MATRRFLTALVLLLAACAHYSPATRSELSEADRLFCAARFTESMARYAALESALPGNFGASLRLGEIALLGNRLDEAEKWLLQASALDPFSHEARKLLAQTYYRKGALPDLPDS